MKLTKTAWIGTLITKKLLLLGDFVPQTPYQVYYSPHFIIKYGLYENESMLAKEFSCKLIWNVCSKYAPKKTTISAKKASASGGLRPPDPYQILYSNKIQ